VRSALLYSYTQSVVGFSVISKCMTLNDTEWLFRVKFCFLTGLAPSGRATFEKLKNYCVKTNVDRHILPAAQIFGGDSIVSDNIKLMRVFAGVL